ncbi:MAG: hypothetical protein IJY30_06095, partial [Muribaculaceae bacterium]|nr:hypothetical protein [Muribaculaceae bacterium]
MDNFSMNQFEQSLSQRVSLVMKRVYFKMFLALLVTAFVSMWAAGSELFISFILQNPSTMWVLLLLEVGLVIAISGAINRL